MSDPGRYAKAAADLKEKIKAVRRANKDFRRFSYDDIQKAVQQAAGLNSAAMQGRADQGRVDLEKALLKIGVRTYPSLKAGKVRGGRHYLLFHHDTTVAKLIDVITEHGKENDAKLAKVAKSVKGWMG